MRERENIDAACKIVDQQESRSNLNIAIKSELENFEYCDGPFSYQLFHKTAI